MPNRDLKNNIAADLAFYAAISTNTTTNGQIVDVAHYDGGIMFTFAAQLYSDGTYTPLLEESEDSGMAGATTIPDERIIGSISEIVSSLSMTTTVGEAISSLGFTSSKRYVRLSIVSTGISIAGATIFAMTHKSPELRPRVPLY